MADVNVLVVFYSRYGRAERLALAVGLGAVQARANIRLRRVPDLSEPTDDGWRANRERMTMDYVNPRAEDVVWADVIAVATPADSCAELEAFLHQLCVATAERTLTRKIAAPITSDNAPSVLGPLYATAAHAGFIVVPSGGAEPDPLARARAHGRRVAELARAIKQTTPDRVQSV
jgi:NAD(P)H dehydrogenase (quinone)